MKYLIVIFISLIANARCRSLTPNLEGPSDEQRLIRVQRIADDDRPASPKEIMDIQLNVLDSLTSSVPANNDFKDTESFNEIEDGQLQKLISLFLNWIGQSSEHDQKVTQWLRQLMLVAKDLSVKVNEVTGSVSDKPAGRTLSSFLKDLYFAQDIHNQRQTTNALEINDETSLNFELPQEKVTMNNSASTSAENERKYVNDILGEAEILMGQIRKFFDKLCRKHHAMHPEGESKVDQSMTANVNQPKAVSVM